MTPIRFSHARGFTYVDVIVALVIIIIVTVFLLPMGHGHSRETANRVKCASNLRQVGQALLLYSNENRGAYPRIRSVESAPVAFYTGVDDTNPFDGVNDPAPNDVTAVMFLLVRTQDIGTEVFTCPSDSGEKYRPADSNLNHGNFPGRKHLSYAITMPYVSAELEKKGYRWNTSAGPEFALAGDIGLGRDASKLTVTAPEAELKKFNSKHHQRYGQNVLFGDGHVEFSNTPLVGFNKDNLYAPAAADDGKGSSLPPGTAPQHGNDSVLLPLDKD